MWNHFFTNNSNRGCQQARQLVAIQVDDFLPDESATRLAAHLATCSNCRQWAGQQKALRDRLRDEKEPPWIMTVAAAERNRSQIQQRLRRKSVMYKQNKPFRA